MTYSEQLQQGYAKGPVPSFPEPISTLHDPAYEYSLELYRKAIEDLTIIHKDGVTVYAGGPMDYENRGQADEDALSQIRDAWLSPVIVEDEDGFSAVHVIQVNTQSVHEDTRMPTVHFVPVSDADLMLDADTPEVQEFLRLLDGNDPNPRIIVRFSTNGNTLYPYITNPSQIPSAEILGRRLAKVADVTGLQIPATNEQLQALSDQRKEAIDIPGFNLDGFQIMEPAIVHTPEGTFYLYGIYGEDDPWQYYELLSPTPLQDTDFNRDIIMRLDSGCDTGQCYGDEGCDCNDQLHDAMKLAAQDGGLLLLCASHNGRGYGLVTKLATEAGKRGIPIGYNNGMGPLDTVESAKKLLGSRYDIRTYSRMAKILKDLGVTSVILFSDNIPKSNALARAGIKVTIQPTGTETKAKKKVRKHIEAKQNSPLYRHNGTDGTNGTNGHDYKNGNGAI
jgi:GTP cyclohydrolase II